MNEADAVMTYWQISEAFKRLAKTLKKRFPNHAKFFELEAERVALRLYVKLAEKEKNHLKTSKSKQVSDVIEAENKRIERLAARLKFLENEGSRVD